MSEIIMVPIDRVKPYSDNPKAHPSTQVRRIAASIRDYGWDQPIVVDSDYVVIKGHGRLKAAHELHLKEVPVIVSDLNEEGARLARILDNKSAEGEYDKENLWGEITDLKKVGISTNQLGFDDKAIMSLFPEEFSLTEEEKTVQKALDEPDERREDVEDITAPLKETMIKAFSGELAFLRKMRMVDYLNWHDKIVVGFSSGKDSMAAMAWILENCERDKVVAVYTNPGWGVDWPHSLAYISVWEKLFGVKVHLVGTPDPAAPRMWEHWLMQIGFPGMKKGCWIESHIKIPQIRAYLHQQGIGNKFGVKTVQIIGIRYEEGANRQKIYPDRGILKDRGDHYASPVIQWLGSDVALYLEKFGVKLHTAYRSESRMGCLLCPKGSATGAIGIRKRFPEHWAKICEWYAMAMRTKVYTPDSFMKWMSSIEDVKETKKFAGEFADMAVDTDEMEKMISEVTGEAHPEGYLYKPFNPGIHSMRNELKKPWWEILEEKR